MKPVDLKVSKIFLTFSDLENNTTTNIVNLFVVDKGQF